METLTFATYVKNLQAGLQPPNGNKDVVELLLSLITEKDFVKNLIGDPIVINDTFVSNLLKQKKNIPESIKNASANPEVVAEAPQYFVDNFMPYFNPYTRNDIFENLYNLVQNSDMAEKTKKRLLAKYDDGDEADFLSDSFLYTLNIPNVFSNKPTTQCLSTSDAINKLNDILQRLPKPVTLLPPVNLEENEMVYTTELLVSYADSEGFATFSKDDLVNYPKYKKNFERQRKDYYAAETIRQSARDTFVLTETDEFEVLKDETYDGIIDVHLQDYPNGYMRLNKVMEHATVIQVDKSLLAKLPNWVGNSEKKGLCHILVNDKKIRWVDNDE